MIENIKEQLATAILLKIPELTSSNIEFSRPDECGIADITIRSFLAAKTLGIKPPEAASKIATCIADEAIVDSIDTIGPYVNIFFNRNLFFKTFLTHFDFDCSFGSSDVGKGKRALIEHTSINPNASPHIGRARNAMIGDSIVRLFRYQGYETDVHYYVNDMGKQIALLALEIKKNKDRESVTFDDMLNIYIQANEKLESDEHYEQQALALLLDFEKQVPEVVDDFHWVVSKCVNGQASILSRMGISYDYFDWESQFINDPDVEKLIADLRDRDVVFIDEHGREVLDLEKIGFEPSSENIGRFVVLRRANGSSMYAYRDIAYNIMKSKLKPDENIIVLGQDHELYFKQISTILATAEATSPEPIYYSFILLKEGKMSTRRGTVVLLSDILDEAKVRAMQLVRDANASLSDSDVESLADKIAIGAIRFSILSVSSSKNVIFDWDQALSFSGDTGPYIQYSCARISSILSKLGETDNLPTIAANAKCNIADAEWQLILELVHMRNKIFAAFQDRKPMIIASYALDIAKAFSRFYNLCPVTQERNPDIKKMRIAICKMTHAILKTLLGLLGIEPPERM